MITTRPHLILTVALALVITLACGADCRAQAQNISLKHESPVPLTLTGAVDMALAHNRKLQLARLSVRESEAEKQIAQAKYYPTLSNVSRVLHITELEGVVVPPGTFGSGTSAGSIPSQTIRIDQGASTAYTSGTGLTQPLTQLLQVRAGVRAANADLGASQIHASDAQNAIALQVHEIFFAYLIERANGVATADALEAARYVEEENQNGLADGRLLANIELRSRADLLEKQRAVLVSKLTMDDLTLQLDNLLGLPIGTKLELDSEALGESQVLPPREQAIESALQASPTVLAARAGVEKARAGLTAAREAYIPNITASARYDYQSGLPFLVHNFGSFGAAFDYVLFDGGAREAKLHDGKTKLQIAQTQLAQAESDIQVEIAAAYDRVDELEQLTRVSELTLQTSEESYRIQVQRSKVDATLNSAIATAKAANTSAKAQLLNAKLALSLAKDNIEKLLGETPH